MTADLASIFGAALAEAVLHVGETAFATTAQGDRADTAVQPEGLSTAVGDAVDLALPAVRNELLARDVCDLRDFNGYDLTGTHETTSVVQAFINSHFVAGFGRIPKGCILSNKLQFNSHYANIQGPGGRATKIRPASDALPALIEVNGAAAKLQGISLESFDFDPGLTKIGNIAIDLKAAAAKLSEIQISGFKRGINAPTGGQHKVDRMRFWKCQEYGIAIGGAGEKVGDCNWTNLIFEGGDDGNPTNDPYTYKGKAMAFLSGANAQYVEDIQVTTWDLGVLIDDDQALGGTFVPDYIYLSMLNSNAPYRYAIRIKKGNSIILETPTLCSWNESAALVETVTTLRVYGGTSARSGKCGWEIYGGSDIRFCNHDIGSNSRLAANTHDGLLITGSAEVHVRGGKIGNALNNLAETQRYGIRVPDGFTGQVHVDGADLRNNGTGPVNLGTGGTKDIRSRLGFVSENHGTTVDISMTGQDIIIPHGLSGVPTFVSAHLVALTGGSPASASHGARVKSYDATNIIVNVSSGSSYLTTGTFRFAWKAEL